MAELTFAEQVALAILDKLALGGVLVGVGYLANKYLESHKTRQALAGEVAKQRIAAVGAVWESLGQYELKAYTSLAAGFAVILEDLRSQGVPLPDPLPRDTRKLALLAAEHRERRVSDGGVERLNTTLAEHSALINTQGDRLVELIASKRFWLGADMHDRLNKYHVQIRRTFRKIRLHADGEDDYKNAYAALVAAREDIEQVAARMLR